jgi:hypothetical protein
MLSKADAFCFSSLLAPDVLIGLHTGLGYYSYKKMAFFRSVPKKPLFIYLSGTGVWIQSLIYVKYMLSHWAAYLSP